MSRDLPPVAPPWPLPVLEHSEFIRLRDRYHDVLDAERDGAAKRLSALLSAVDSADMIVKGCIMDMGGRVAIYVRMKGHAPETMHRPTQGFDSVELAAILDEYRAKCT